MVKFSEILNNKKEEKPKVEEKKEILSQELEKELDDSQKQYKKLLETCEKTCDKVYLKLSRKEKLSINEIKEFKKDIEETVEFLFNIENPLLIEEIFRDYPIEEYPKYHPRDVAFLSILIGKKLGYSKENLVELGIAGLLHEIGMFFLPQDVVLKKPKLTEEELEQVKKHPEYAAKYLSTVEDITENIIIAIYQEHERADGTGYPKGLKNEQIHEWAKIIGISDTFVAMIHSRPYREKKLHPDKAISEIIEINGNHFSKDVVIAFLSLITPYPIGSWVKLNNGEIGKVKKINEGSPKQPVVEIYFDSTGKKLQVPKEIDLSKESLYFISESITK